MRVAVFELRLSHSGAAVHVAYGSEGQEAFLEGHVTAFARIGGVPGRIRYDNARALVARVLRGRDRQETERFIALRSHYGFDSFFCLPGQAGAHEKGGIEGEVGRSRRRHFVPMPKVTSLAELNRRLEAADRADLARHIGTRRQTVGALPGETSCVTMDWAVMDLVIAGSRGLGLTLPERHAIAGLVVARSTPQAESRSPNLPVPRSLCRQSFPADPGRDRATLLLDRPR